MFLKEFHLKISEVSTDAEGLLSADSILPKILDIGLPLTIPAMGGGHQQVFKLLVKLINKATRTPV